MTIDYKQLETLVREAMFTGGGINEPSAPAGVPHRMPAAELPDKEQDMGDPEANEMYSMAVKARAAVQELIEALDEPIFDGAYEHAFKASACLRKTLNSLEQAGAHPMPDEQVVAPPADRQRWGGYVPYQGAIDYGAGAMGPPGLEEEAPKAGARSKKIAAATGAGATQTSADIEQQLASVLTGGGVTPLKLRDALISLLTDLGLKNAKQVALLIAKGLAAKQKGQ